MREAYCVKEIEKTIYPIGKPIRLRLQLRRGKKIENEANLG